MINGTRRGRGVSVTPRPLFSPGKDPVPIVQEAGWSPGPVWTGAENLAATGIRSPDRPARSHLLYRLSYPAHTRIKDMLIFYTTQSKTAIVPVPYGPNQQNEAICCHFLSVLVDIYFFPKALGCYRTIYLFPSKASRT